MSERWRRTVWCHRHETPELVEKVEERRLGPVPRSLYIAGTLACGERFSVVASPHNVTMMLEGA